MSAGLMMPAYYLTVSANDSLHSVFSPHLSSCHPLHFHGHRASQTGLISIQTDTCARWKAFYNIKKGKKSNPTSYNETYM